ncbi:hypothetical protein HH214_12970 [Mucilaginibacter robiniae]|uniref:Uncharacterized protein n=1 Tax=Mucilaginibacter robiniae TaxID=2728022 RepID=A0A7L5E2C7_9SPHI|nr:hypothetical protein [Mucilaginibacter robiniae]QJD96718.1 hypothetical protein HH214_12970 [Mucilaginibacter robiniae]
MFNLKFAAKHILHRFKAITRHGLHSPFVYRLVDEVIYDFSPKKVYADMQNSLADVHKLNRVDKLLYRLVSDAHPRHLYTLTEPTPADQLIMQTAAPQATWLKPEQPTPADLIWIDAHQHPERLWLYFEQSLTHVQAQTCMLIKNVHRNAQTEQAWQAIKANPQVTVTVDLFWLGLVYFRTGQVREDFLIRF